MPHKLPELFDVFLSCRGDILKTHAEPLYLALLSANLRTFFYVERRNPGGRIIEKIRDGIKHSASAIIIFSRYFAGSNWCLDELLLILDRVQTSYFPLIPIYCDGVSYEMFEEGGFYQTALEVHREKFGNEKVKMWSEALKQVEGREHKDAKGTKLELDKFFEEIAEEIREKVVAPNVRVPLNIPKRRWRHFAWRILRIDRERRTAATGHPEGTGSAAVQPQFEEINTENDHQQRQPAPRAINADQSVNQRPTNQRKGKEVMDPCVQEINGSVHHSLPTNEKNDPKRRLQNFIRKIIAKNNTEKEIKKLSIHQGGIVTMKTTPDLAGMISMNVTQHPATRMVPVARVQPKGPHSEENRENYNLKRQEYGQAISTVEQPIVNIGSTSRQGKEVMMDPSFEEINGSVYDQQVGKHEQETTCHVRRESIHPRRRLQHYIRKIIKYNRAKKRTSVPNVSTLHPGTTDPVARHRHSNQIDDDRNSQNRPNPAVVESIFVNGGPGFEEIVSESANVQQVGNQEQQEAYLVEDELVGKKSCIWSCGLGPLCVFILTAHRNFVDNLIRKFSN